MAVIISHDSSAGELGPQMELFRRIDYVLCFHFSITLVELDAGPQFPGRSFQVQVQVQVQVRKSSEISQDKAIIGLGRMSSPMVTRPSPMELDIY